jgi:DNA-binding MarR family transcriptional regulator
VHVHISAGDVHGPEGELMAGTELTPSDLCHCLAVRQAGRWITQLYDQHLAGCGLRASQYAVLSRLERLGPTGIAELAEALVMDRTTTTRTIAPLQRDGLVEIAPAEDDRRRKCVALTARGRATLAEARPHWKRAQAAFEKHFGPQQAAAMRDLLRQVPHGLARHGG